MNWRQENQALEDAYARGLLIEYNIREVTTQRQAKNGTREFEFPVKTSWKKEPLRIACFKSGYVRRQNDTHSPYQLNKKYKSEIRYTLLSSKVGIFSLKGKMWRRELIPNGLARMIYMLEFYKRNYLNNK